MGFLAPLGALFGVGGGAAAGGLGAAAGIGSGILGVVGTVVSVAAAGAQAASAKAQADYQAKVAQNNAIIAKKNAERSSDASQQQQVQQDMETRAFIGQQEAIQSGSGLSVSGGSQLRTRRSAARLGDVDRNNIREAGNTDIINYLQQSENFTSQASAAKAQGRGAILEGFLNASNSLISSASSVRSPGRVRASGRSSLGGFAPTLAGGSYR